MSFKNLGLNTQLLENLIDLGYKEATKIQELAIPKVLSGKMLLLWPKPVREKQLYLVFL